MNTIFMYMLEWEKKKVGGGRFFLFILANDSTSGWWPHLSHRSNHLDLWRRSIDSLRTDFDGNQFCIVHPSPKLEK